MEVSLWYNGPQHTAFCDFLVTWFSSTLPLNSSLWCDVQCLWKLTEWFPRIGLFYRHIWARWHWTVVSKSLSSGYHFGFKNFLVLVLIIIFSRKFPSFLMLSRNLCWYKALPLNDWYTPIITICCFIHFDCNNPLRITHCFSN